MIYWGCMFVLAVGVFVSMLIAILSDAPDPSGWAFLIVGGMVLLIAHRLDEEIKDFRNSRK